MAQGGDRDFPEVPDRPSPVSLYPWLLIAASAAIDAGHGKFHPAWLAVAGLAAFAALYVATLWVRWRSGRPRAAYWLLAGLGAVTLGLNLGFGQGMTALFPLLAIACGAVIPWVMPRSGHGPPLPILTVFIVAVVSMLIAIGQGASPGDIWSAWYGPALSGLVVAIIYRFIEAVAELRRTREELARSAVDAERLRFARDMHDLLGHTLSVMVVKAQVTRKLVTRDPAQAQQQALDIEDDRPGGAQRGPPGDRRLPRPGPGARARGGPRRAGRRGRDGGGPAGRPAGPGRGGRPARLGGARGRHQRHPAQRRRAGARSRCAARTGASRSRSATTAAARGQTGSLAGSLAGEAAPGAVRRARAARAAGTARRRRRHAGGGPAARRRLLPHRRRPGPGAFEGACR